jgi:mannose-6-phosphate isomerase-like protein (cupin superfamily)
MANPQKKSIDKADETRTFDKGHLDLVQMDGLTVGRATFEPGWKWSECVKPVAGTDSCQVHHNGYIVSGSLQIVMDNGTEVQVGPGDVFVCPPGHDAWTLGDEACIALDFSSDMANYAT